MYKLFTQAPITTKITNLLKCLLAVRCLCIVERPRTFNKGLQSLRYGSSYTKPALNLFPLFNIGQFYFLSSFPAYKPSWTHSSNRLLVFRRLFVLVKMQSFAIIVIWGYVYQRPPQLSVNCSVLSGPGLLEIAVAAEKIYIGGSWNLIPE